MPDDNNTPNTPGDAGQGALGAPAAAQTQTPQTPSNTPENSGLSEAEAAARIEKARAEEKQKAYGKIDTLNKEKQELAERYKKAEEELAAARQNLNEMREGKSTEVDSLQKELIQLRDRGEKLEKTVETVAEEAAQRVQQFEVQAYRERVIREKNIELAELVGGKTTEEVDNSVQAALQREAELKAKFAGAAQTPPPAAPPTTPTPEAAQPPAQPPAQQPPAQQPPVDTSSLPRPINPDGSQGRDPLDAVSPLNREALTKLPKEEYLKHRKEILAAAKQKSGLL
jgi:DNA polymerase III alpha subunit (gram-positive type)